MPTWGEILRQLNSTATPQGTRDYDSVRRGYLSALHALTGRAVILYETAFLESRQIAPADLQITLADIQGFMETVSGVKERQLDLILHSPGGLADAAEAIVDYLRSQFEHIRVFVPVAAMSAATMVALAADEIVMGEHSQLGPIDPQFNIVTPEGPRSAPARAILKQFELAKAQCQNPNNLPAWLPILRTYAPALLTQCEDSEELAVTMVSKWLKIYMFAGQLDAETKATSIAKWFGNYEEFHSHSRRIGLKQAIDVGLKVRRLEDDDGLQDAVLSIHHATAHTFSGTITAKIIENHNGRAFVRFGGQQVTAQLVPVAQPTRPLNPSPPTPSGENRATRRAKRRG